MPIKNHFGISSITKLEILVKSTIKWTNKLIIK